MGFTWNNKENDKEHIATIEDDLNYKSEYYEENSCQIFCNSDSPTCTNRSKDAVQYNTRINMCWDNTENLKLDTVTGLFTDGSLYFLHGECSQCGEYYFSEVSKNTLPTILCELCRKCKPEGR